jgi:hypothetical protein
MTAKGIADRILRLPLMSATVPPSINVFHADAEAIRRKKFRVRVMIILMSHDAA